MPGFQKADATILTVLNAATHDIAAAIVFLTAQKQAAAQIAIEMILSVFFIKISFQSKSNIKNFQINTL